MKTKYYWSACTVANSPLKCYNIGMETKLWTKEETNILKKNWDKVHRIKELIPLLPTRTLESIALKGWKMKLSNRNHFKGANPNPSVDQDFFKKWSDNMAYILGLLAADGYLNSTGRQHRIGIGLIRSDIKLLQDVRDCIGKKLNIYYSENNAVFSFGCKEIFNDLIKLGITPRKSFTLKFPKVPNKYLSHFIRGYFDGDGCLCIQNKFEHKRNRFQITIVSTESFLKVSKKKIQKILNIYISEIKKDRKSDIYTFVMCSQNALKFADWMYKDSNLKLDRKYKKYLEAKKLYKDKNIKIGNNQYTKQ